MSNSDPTKKTKKVPVPTFSGTPLPAEVSTGSIEGVGDQATRRVGGGAGIAVMPVPSFEPLGSYNAQHQMGASLDTRPQKTAPRQQVGFNMPPVKQAGWQMSDVPMLPEFHPVERTAVFVTNASVAEITERIATVLRERSIEATYDNVKAKAKCLTADQVDFRVRLYRGRGIYRNGIIIEVQRRFGSSTNFVYDTRAILDAAEGKDTAAIPPPLTGGNLPVVVSDSEDDADMSSSSSSLAVISKMLQNPGIDAHALALQTLSTLTDPAKMGAKTALKASKKILAPGNEVGAKVVSLVVDRQDLQDEEEAESFGLRVMAMAALSNAIRMVNGKISPNLRERLRPVLIEELRGADSNPRMAHLAARCIEPLLHGAYEPNEFYDPIESARRVGDVKYAALAQQADICINIIDSR